ncbi:Crossover junction endonuclease MUS81 [Blattella germanica]|nr:Crossover junction endonuclease MUS81 [Blattella germanica]
MAIAADHPSDSLSMKEVPDKKSKEMGKPKDSLKRSRMYVPAVRSGSYALLLTLLNASESSGYQGFLTKPQLQSLAQPLCDTCFKKADPGSHYTAWSSMSGLVKRGLVLRQGCPAKFSLTDAGSELAHQLQKASIGKNTCSLDPTEVSDVEDESNSTSSCHSNPTLSSANVTSETYGQDSVQALQLINEPNSRAPKSDGTEVESLYSQKTSNLSYKMPYTLPFVDATTNEDTTILLPGSFDIILLVDKQETVGGPLPKLVQEDAIVRELTVTGTQFELRHLKVGDYTWICRDRRTNKEMVLPFIVERKRMDDLAKSIRDGRYHEQKFRLKQCGIQNLIYLVESHGDNTHTTLPLPSLEQAAVNTQIVDRFSVKKTSNVHETVLYLATMTRLLIKFYSKKTIVKCERENLPPCLITDDLMSLMMFAEFNNSSSKRKVLGTQSMFIKQLVQLNGMSVAKAQAIVNSYPTPRVLMAAYQEVGAAGEKLLATIRYGPMKRMIGPVISKSIYQLYTGLNHV